MTPLRRLLTTLTLITAVITGLLAIIGDLTPDDTAWGAPHTTTPVTDTVDGVSATLLDTAWGS